MVFGQLCAPALIYIVFSITQITMDSLKGLYNVAFVKLFISLLFTILLNHLCQRGLGIISWIIVFIPFMLMSLITALLLALFGMDAVTGKLKLQEDEPVEEKEDVREKAIADYSMNRSKEDYIKRLEEMGYDMSYLDLKGKGGQSVINPAHNDMYHSLHSDSTYELVKSGTARSKLMTRAIAEELYYTLESKVSNNEIRLEQDENGKIKAAFLENCDYMINVLYEDLYYRLDKDYKAFDVERPGDIFVNIDKALREMKTWGVLRNINGNVTSHNDFDVHKIRNYASQLTDDHITEFQQKVGERLQTRFQTKCQKLQVKLDNFAKRENIDFSKVFSEESESDAINLLDRAYSSDILNDGFAAPTTCTPEMREMCKVQKRGQCRPCSEDDIIEGTTGEDSYVACPHLCDNLGSNKLCQYCSMCSGGEVKGRMPPPGTTWTKYTELDYKEAPTSYPTNFEDATNPEWWKRYTVIDDENADPSLLVTGSTSVRSCQGDSRFAVSPPSKQKIIIKFKTSPGRWSGTNQPFHVEFYNGNKTTKIGEKQQLFDKISKNTEIEKEFELEGVGPNDKIWVKVTMDSTDGITLKKFTTIYNNNTIEYTNTNSTKGGAPDNTVGIMDKDGSEITTRWFTKINE